MPLELVERISRELQGFPNIKQLYLNGYDEPTLNPLLPAVVRALAPLNAKISLLTNGTRLTPALVRELVDCGADIELDIHLAAVNRRDFERAHQSALFDAVMKNIEALRSFEPLHSVQVHISMIERGDETDEVIFAEIRGAFADAPFKVHAWRANDRAGLLRNEYALDIHHRGRIYGCKLQNRVEEWLHINATGRVILCCQDYHEAHVLGDVRARTLTEILASPSRSQHRQWTNGDIDAPASHICRRCAFAETERP